MTGFRFTVAADLIDTTTSQVVEVDYYYRKYYYAGNTRIAMRYYEDGVPTQYWLLSDQVNSQSVTLNEDGSTHSEVRYTGFGGATGGGDALAQQRLGDR